jgi:single-strand DNA-binding protein
MAVNRWSKNGEFTDWFNIELWDKQAEIAGEYVKKGRMVAVDGRLVINKWTAQDGTQRERYVVIASNLKLLGAKRPRIIRRFLCFYLTI